MNIQKQLKQLSEYGIGINDFESEKIHLQKKFGKPPTEEDIIFSLYNKLIAETIDLQDLKRIYYSLALFLNEEGRDCLNANRSSAKMELAFLKQSGVKKIEILCNSDCDECKKLTGKIFDIEQAMAEMPIPNESCTFRLFNDTKGFCRCEYLPVLDL